LALRGAAYLRNAVVPAVEQNIGRTVSERNTVFRGEDRQKEGRPKDQAT